MEESNRSMSEEKELFKKEPECESNSGNLCGVSETAAQDEFYADLVIKVELVEPEEHPTDESTEHASLEAPPTQAHAESSVEPLTTKRRKDTRTKHICNICNKQLKQSSDLRKHMRTHTGEKPYTCEVCRRNFRRLDSLKSHKKIHMPHRKLYTCKICNKQYTQQSSLRKHELISHSGVTFACNICDKQFTSSFYLRTHERVHTGERPHTCDVCDKNFSTISILKSHERTHTGERPYPCDRCEKSFGHSSTLRKHKLVHTGEKPFECDICNKRFRQSNNLKKHRRSHARKQSKPSSTKQAKVHTKEVHSCKFCSWLTSKTLDHTEAHVCEICQEKFTDSGALEAHKQSHIGDNVCDEHVTLRDSNSDQINERFACNECALEFTTKDATVDHIRGHENSTLSQAPALTKEEPTEESEWEASNSCESETAGLCPRDVMGERDDLCPSQGVKLERDGLCSNEDVKGEVMLGPERTQLVFAVPYESNAAQSDDQPDDEKTHAAETQRDTISTTRTPIYTRRKKHVCNVCNKEFKLLNHLRKHRRSHTGEDAKVPKTQGSKPRTKKRYICDVCNKECKQMCELKNHIRTHTGEKPFICDVCDMRFTRLDSLKSHKQVHTQTTLYSCEICSKQYYFLSSLNYHRQSHAEPTFSCEVCQKRFRYRASLVKHNLTHTGQKPHVCDICNKQFSHLTNLERHKLIHTGEKRFECDICNKRFTESGTLKTHKLIHTGEKPYSCEFCEKTFRQLCNLKKHRLIHTGDAETREKPAVSTVTPKEYSCDVCGKEFSRLGNLVTHKSVHTGEKLFCEICEKEFSDATKLKRHKKTHTGDKKKSYWCEICGALFGRSNALRDHVRIHTGEKPFSCDICSMQFRKKETLVKHTVRHAKRALKDEMKTNETHHLS